MIGIIQSPDQVHASFPEKKEESTPQSHDKSVSKTNYTYEELKSYLINKLPELYIQEHFELDERINDLLKIVLYFYKQYKIYRGENHPILSDIAYRKIVIEYLCPPETMSTYGEFSFDAYKDMIDKYFNTEYGKYGGTPENFNYRLSHFMSDNIREHLYRQVTGL